MFREQSYPFHDTLVVVDHKVSHRFRINGQAFAAPFALH